MKTLILLAIVIAVVACEGSGGEDEGERTAGRNGELEFEAEEDPCRLPDVADETACEHIP